jgi:predicted DCC family thiol-disulfide oxidoreductase YuxK
MEDMVSERLQKLIEDGPIVFYDGECGLCDWSIKRLLRVDKGRKLRFATLQGKTALEAIGAPQGDCGNWSVKLLDEQGLHDRSTAALRALAHCGGAWKLAAVFLAVPRFIRDGIYRFVATNRFHWFGRVDACMLPSPSMQERFLP